MRRPYPSSKNLGILALVVHVAGQKQLSFCLFGQRLGDPNMCCVKPVFLQKPLAEKTEAVVFQTDCPPIVERERLFLHVRFGDVQAVVRAQDAEVNGQGYATLRRVRLDSMSHCWADHCRKNGSQSMNDNIVFAHGSLLHRGYGV